MKALVTELQEQAEKIRLGKYDGLDLKIITWYLALYLKELAMAH